MINTKMRVNCRNISGILQVLIHKVPTMKWCIVRKIHGNVKSDFCKLCLNEKYFILNNPGTTDYLIRNLNFLINVAIRKNCYYAVFYVKTVWIRCFSVFDILVFYI